MDWSWPAFFSYLRSPDIFHGVWTTIYLTVISMVSGLTIGVFASVLYRLNNPIISTVYYAYITLIRGTPLLVQLVFVYSGLPKFGIRLGVVESALLALSLNEGAYLAEVMRSGIDSVPKGQVEAAKALGMTYWQAMYFVILPQAVRTVAPVIGNQVNILLKSTSLVSVISMEELFRTTEELIQSDFRVLELFSVASLYYLLLTTTWSITQSKLESWLRSGIGQRDSLRKEDQPLALPGS